MIILFIDILLQSKSGTGKTLVFSTIALEKFRKDIRHPQTLILCPTREIAVQTADTLRTIGKYLPGFKVTTIIGGHSSATEDRLNLQDTSAIVATPGRILHLIEVNFLNTKCINLLILDEVDQLVEKNFNLNKIVSTLDVAKLQVLSVSATLDEETQSLVKKFMKNPIGITPAKEIPVLKGIAQIKCRIQDDGTGQLEMMLKFNKLKEILSKITFKQCFLFVNSQSQAESYKQLLAKEDWPSEVIMGSYDQSWRLKVMRKLKEFQIRILLSTDLMARGIDAENVNLVVNMDVPRNGMVYLHRIGRAGRFGTRGLAITLLGSEEQERKFSEIQQQFAMEGKVMELPQVIQSEEIWRLTEVSHEAEHNEEEIEGNRTYVVKTNDNKCSVLEEFKTFSGVQLQKGKIRKSVTFEEDTETDPLSLLLDSTSLNEAKKSQKESTPVANILDEFDQFSESELDKEKDNEIETATVATDCASLVNNIGSSIDELCGQYGDEEEEDEEEIDTIVEKTTKMLERRPKSGQKGGRIKQDKKQGIVLEDPLENWYNLFNRQSAMIMNYVAFNSQAKQKFGGYV